MEKPDAMSQFEAFCVQLSIRIYWMERAAGLVKDAPATPLARRVGAAESEEENAGRAIEAPTPRRNCRRVRPSRPERARPRREVWRGSIGEGG